MMASTGKQTQAYATHMSKTVEVQLVKDQVKPQTLEASATKQVQARQGRRQQAEGSIDRPTVVNIYETSLQREAAGVNVSYDNSFSAIKNNIFNFKGGKELA